MKKAIGIFCITISLASLGWKLMQAYFTPGRTTSYINGKAVKQGYFIHLKDFLCITPWFFGHRVMSS
jgi:hypothetical protein